MKQHWWQAIYSVTCRKRIFDSTGAAQKALRNIALRNEISVSDKRKEKRYYFCKNCLNYHLTSKDAWNKEDGEVKEPAIKYIKFQPYITLHEKRNQD